MLLLAVCDYLSDLVAALEECRCARPPFWLERLPTVVWAILFWMLSCGQSDNRSHCCRVKAHAFHALCLVELYMAA